MKNYNTESDGSILKPEDERSIIESREVLLHWSAKIKLLLQ